MKTHTLPNSLEFKGLNFTRAQKAKQPSKQEITNALKEANDKYNKGAGRTFLPEIYTR